MNVFWADFTLIQAAQSCLLRKAEPPGVTIPGVLLGTQLFPAPIPSFCLPSPGDMIGPSRESLLFSRVGGLEGTGLTRL
jgi:hypothetical protein